MFNETFYPTPEPAIKEMLTGVTVPQNAMILDPSAGKGDILDYIREHKNSYGIKLFACEIVPELRAILTDKGYPVLADDFLIYHPTIYFTLIVMNPPFKYAEEHIFRAFDVLGHGELVSIVPTASLDGKNAKERLLLNMIEQHGEVRDIGQAFRHAERPTYEPVSIVRLKKEEDPFNLNFDPVNEQAQTFHFSMDDNELAIPGFLPGLIAQYKAAFGAFDGYLKARVKIEHYLKDNFETYDEKTSPLKAIDSGSPQNRFNAFTMRMNILAWEKLLDHPQFQAILTARAREMIRKFRSTQRYLDFNEENIKQVFRQIVHMAPDLLDACIDDAFDKMTQYYPGNRDHWEGWKTDLAWKVAPRCVLPYVIATGLYRHSRHRVNVSYNAQDELNDIDRAMCVISGRPFSEIVTIVEALEGVPYGEKVYSTFFELRGYLKGTLHMHFRDLDLLKEFNYRAAKNKGWLPDGTQTRFRI